MRALVAIVVVLMVRLDVADEEDEGPIAVALLEELQRDVGHGIHAIAALGEVISRAIAPEHVTVVGV